MGFSATVESLFMLRHCLAFLLVLHCVFGAGLHPDLERISEEIRHSNKLLSSLHALCDQIGPRMAGTAGMQQALQWARQEFKEAGIESVWLDAVSIPIQWQEGKTRIEVTEPVQFRLQAVATAMSPAVRLGFEAELADAGTGVPGAIRRNPRRFRGKILLIKLDEARTFEELSIEQRDAIVAMREAAEVGAKAVVLISTRPNRLLYRHIHDISGRLDPVPSALVSREDGLRLLRILQEDVPVRVAFEMPNHIGGAFETANVVAEIKGKNYPHEIVVLGAHLDSWDLGTGCQDNAVNVALVIEVARLLHSLDLQLDRTLRFVLFGGEELGLFGSRSYVERYRAELDQHVAVIIHDMGDGSLIGYSVGSRGDLLPTLKSVVGTLAVSDSMNLARNTIFISDNFPFMLQGVPNLFAVQNVSSYSRNYHAESDTLDKVDVNELRTLTAVAATTLMSIANLEDRFGVRLDDRQVHQQLEQARLIEHLKFLGVWNDWRIGVSSDNSARRTDEPAVRVD